MKAVKVYIVIAAIAIVLQIYHVYNTLGVILGA